MAPKVGQKSQGKAMLRSFFRASAQHSGFTGEGMHDLFGLCF
jgi:hypothetical protein